MLQAQDKHVDVDLILEAPTICIPLSVPEQTVIVNMGTLKLSNDCVIEAVVYKGYDGDEEKEVKGVFEKFTISLDNFSISRYFILKLYI